MADARDVTAAGTDPAAPRPQPRDCADLFWSFTWLALQGFGGVLAVVQRELVEKKRWMTNDEFVELVNMTVVALDLGGMTISDATGVRHTFPAGTVLPPLGTLVVFGGGGAPNGLFGGALVTRASAGPLGLNNDGDTVTLRRGSTVIDSVTYSGTIASMDESIVRMTEGDVAATMVRHTTLRTGVRFTPGTRVSGFAF